MALDNVRSYVEGVGLEERVMVFPVSSATVPLAAEAAGVIPARIAKTLSFYGSDGVIVVVVAGDTKIDSRKFKEIFHVKSKMLRPEDVLEQTGHPVGGVCPFLLPKDVKVYLDESLKRFVTVFPACGSDYSAVELTPEELFMHSKALSWVDVCKGWHHQNMCFL